MSTVREHRYSSLEALQAADLQPGARWLLNLAGQKWAGVVAPDGTLSPCPYGSHEFAAVQLGSLSWTKTVGDDTDIVIDENGVQLTGDPASNATGVILAGLSHTGPVIVQSTIEIVSVDTPTQDMLAVFGLRNDAGVDDWVAGGWIYDASQWRSTNWGHDYNDGVPVLSDVTPAIDLSSYTAGGKFQLELLPKYASVAWATSCMADEASGTVRVAPGAVLTCTNFAAPVDTFNPFFYVEAPGGTLTARLTNMKIAPADWMGFWS